MAAIRMYFALWCGDCRAARQFLDERSVAYEPLNIEEDPEAAERIIERNEGKRKIPTFEVDDRWFALSPFDPDLLAEELGL